MRPYLGAPWTDFHQIWVVEVFHLVLRIYGIQSLKCKKKLLFFFDVITSVLYCLISPVLFAKSLVIFVHSLSYLYHFPQYPFGLFHVPAPKLTAHYIFRNWCWGYQVTLSFGTDYKYTAKPLFHQSPTIHSDSTVTGEWYCNHRLILACGKY